MLASLSVCMPAFSLRSLRFYEQPCLKKAWRHLEKLLRVSMVGDEISLRNITGLNLSARRRGITGFVVRSVGVRSLRKRKKWSFAAKGPTGDRDDNALPRRA